MEERQVKIILKYKNKNEQNEMTFIPESYKDLKDYFLTVFREESWKKFIFYFEKEDNQTITIQDSNFNDVMKEISQQNNPIIYISEKNDSTLSRHSQNDNIKNENKN